jgi:acyl dehydratase
MRTINGIEQLNSAVGEELGVTDWYEVSQERINAFAHASNDLYWLHIDPQRASQSPLGGTIAHGLFTLSLGPMFTDEIVSFEGFSVRLNYGYEKVRFPASLPTGSRIRMRSQLEKVAAVDGGAQAYLKQTFEREGQEKPVCVASAILRLVT